jgi:hypothetical protein
MRRLHILAILISILLCGCISQKSPCNGGFQRQSKASTKKLPQAAVLAIRVWNLADESFVYYKSQTPLTERCKSFNSLLDDFSRQEGFSSWRVLRRIAWRNLSEEEYLLVMSLCHIEHAYITHKESQRRLIPLLSE